MTSGTGGGDFPQDGAPGEKWAGRRIAFAMIGVGGPLWHEVAVADGFGLLAPEAAPPPADPTLPGRLDVLAAALVDAPCDPVEAEGDLPAAYPLFGRLIDHDIAAPATRNAPTHLGEGLRFPAPEGNPRDGALRLDSLYRAGAGPGPLAEKLDRLMREPHSMALMRLDVAEPSDVGAVALPADGGADLLRLGRLMADDPARGITPEEILAAPPALRARLAPAGRIDPRRAVIGDPRNDQSLLIAQFSLAMLRFHNRVVEWAVDTGAAGPEQLFETARRLVRWHVQWLVLNDYLPRLCAPAVLDRVRRAGAPLYGEFRRRAAPAGGDRLPVPLEYAAAASRFRHSMGRARWDLNRFHGRAEEGAPPPLTPRADIDLLISWSGPCMAAQRLPSHLVIDWSRLLGDPPRHRDRAARRIDTFFAPPRDAHGHGDADAFRRTARQFLHDDLALRLPSAQTVIASFNGVYDGLIRPLTEAQLTAGHTGEAVRDGFVERTPIWFYVLKEAEVQSGGLRLGQLGSALVAETLVGLIANDRHSVWGRRSRDGGPWTPRDGARPDGLTIDGLPALFKAAGLL